MGVNVPLPIDNPGTNDCLSIQNADTSLDYVDLYINFKGVFQIKGVVFITNGLLTDAFDG
jgi:hypothetical protein